ncbi:MAG: flippase-like domain-containing protein [Alphaproteobacteria bacterium]|nr:flippase-like domain-containing protein [Alphaproteobacteria bacterium]
MLRWAIALGLLGLFAATVLIAKAGWQEVFSALQEAGWKGVLIPALFHLIPMLACVLGWQALWPGKTRASKMFFFYTLWLRSSINNLMPVARIGGEVVAVRIMIKHGLRKAPSIACTVVETTLSALAQFAFVLLGVFSFLFYMAGKHGADSHIGWKLFIGLALSLPFLGAFLYIQKVGIFTLFEKFFTFFLKDKWKSLSAGAARLDRSVRLMYKRKNTACYCFVMQFLSWALCAVELWLVLYFLGHPLSLAECLMLEALIQGVWGAAFMVPAALGVQEAAFVFFGAMFGLPLEMALALAVLRRCRDIILYVPGLIAWQLQEGRWLLRKA